jgi:3-oxoacyl-[acyl-carrier protein] reductase
MIDRGLKDKVVLVTGGNNRCGTGAATARAFAAEGANVFIHYFRRLPEDCGISAEEARQATTPSWAFYVARQNESADAVVQEIRDSGGQSDSWEGDLADPATIPRLFDQAEEVFGPVDVLVNNAAGNVRDTFIPQSQLGQGVLGVYYDEVDSTGSSSSTVTAETYDENFAVNARALALMMAEYARHLIDGGKRWGRIINVSTAGAPGWFDEVSYGASKHAMESYSRAAADGLGRYGITVNVVSLGPIQTGWATPEIEEEQAKRTPLGRMGQPEDVADVIVFLASEQARWISMQLLHVGGGYCMPL